LDALRRDRLDALRRDFLDALRRDFLETLRRDFLEALRRDFLEALRREADRLDLRDADRRDLRRFAAAAAPVALRFFIVPTSTVGKSYLCGFFRYLSSLTTVLLCPRSYVILWRIPRADANLPLRLAFLYHRLKASSAWALVMGL
jgi:hypothetical protein